MRPMEVQYITREMIARLKGPESLLRMALTDGEWERRAARMLVVGTLAVLAGLAIASLLVGA